MTSTSPRICKRICHIYLHTNKQTKTTGTPNNKHVSLLRTRTGRPAAKLSAAVPCSSYPKPSLSLQFIISCCWNRRKSMTIITIEEEAGSDKRVSWVNTAVLSLVRQWGRKKWVLFSARQVYRPFSRCMFRATRALSMFTATDWHPGKQRFVSWRHRASGTFRLWRQKTAGCT